MKNLFSFFMATMCVLSMSAQSVPQKINYQAVAHDNNGEVLANTSLNVTVGILSGSTTGTLVYEETHSVTSNQYGLFYFKIGEGLVNSGTMTSISWESNDHFVNVNVNGDDLGTTQLVSVPYALVSGSTSGINGSTISNGVVNDGDVLVFNGTSGQWEAQAPGTGGANGLNSIITATIENPGANCATGGSFVEYGTDDDNSGVLDAGEVDGSYYVCNGADGVAGTNGTDGNTWTTGTGAPTGGVNAGDMYLDVTTNDFYSFDGSVWNLDGNLSGTETATTLVNNGDGTFTYTNELGTTTTFDTTATAQTTSTLVNNGDGTFTYTDELGTSISFDTTGLEVTSTLVNNGDGTFTYTDETGSSISFDTTFTETTTTLNNNGDGTFTFTNELGTTTTFDTTAAAQTTSTLVNNGDGTFTYTDELGTSTSFDTTGLEVTSTLVNNGDGTFTYTDESGSAISFDTTFTETTTTLNNNGDGTFTFTNELGTTTTFDTTATAQTTSTLVNNGDGTFTYTDELGTSTSFDTTFVELDADPTNEWNTNVGLNATLDSLIVEDFGNRFAISLVDLNQDDADADPTNEWNTNVGLNATLDSLIVEDFGNRFAISLVDLNQDDADADPTNEWNTNVGLNGSLDSLIVEDFGNRFAISLVDLNQDDADADPTNEWNTNVGLNATLDSLIVEDFGNRFAISLVDLNQDDADADPTNEWNTNVGLNGTLDSLIVEDFGNRFAISLVDLNQDDADADPTNEWNTNVGLNGTLDSLIVEDFGNRFAISLVDLNQDDADADPTNEWNTNVGLNGTLDSLIVEDFGNRFAISLVDLNQDDADADPTNEWNTNVGLNGTLDSLIVEDFGNRFAISLVDLNQDDADADPTNEWNTNVGLNGTLDSLIVEDFGNRFAISLVDLNQDDADADPNNEIELPAQVGGDAGNFLQADGAGNVSYVAAPAADNWGTDVVNSDATLSGDGTVGTPLTVVGDLTDDQDVSISGNAVAISGGSGFDLSTTPPNAFDVLTWNGSAWEAQAAITGSDDQNISGSNLAGSILTIGIENGTSETVDLSALSDGNGIYDGSGTAPSNTAVTVTDNIDFDAGTLFIDGTSNEIGIGTTSPGAMLEVTEDIIVNNVVVGKGGGSLGGNVILGQPGTFGANTSGTNNTAIGTAALQQNTSGGENVALGFIALGDNTTGDGNVGLGRAALPNNNSGFQNVGIGDQVMFDNTTGFYNVAIGKTALQTNVTGNRITAIGVNADVAATNLNNATAIGAEAEVSASNSLVLGSINGVNGSSADTKVGIGTTAPSNRLEVVGDAAKFDSVIIVNGAAPGYILQSSNGAGNAEWVDPSSFGGSSFWTESGGDTYLTNTSQQVGIGTTTPGYSLEVSGTDGILVPSGTTAERPTATPGVIRYNTTNFALEFFDGAFWQSFGIGNITSVVAGTGLTGGGVSGSVTLDVDPSAIDLDDLGNVILTTPANGEILEFNGTNWVNTTITGDGNGIYDGNGTTPSNTAVTVTDNIDFDAGTLFIDGTNNRIGIGTNAPQTDLHLVHDGGDAESVIQSFGGDPRLFFLQAEGSEASPTATLSGSIIGSQVFYGNAGSGPTQGAEIATFATENWSAGGYGAGIGFSTVQNGTTTVPDLRMIIDHDGSVGINEPAPSATLDIVGTMQYVDGNEAAGYVLTSDATGNATWQAASGGSSAWDLLGNAGTSATDFIGTTDGQALRFKTNNTQAMYIDQTTQHVGIGNENPLGVLHTTTEGSANFLISEAVSSGAADDAASLQMVRSRGTIGAKTNVLNGDRLGLLAFNGYNSGSGDYEESAQILVDAAEDFNSTGSGGRMTIKTTPVGLGSAVDAMIIDENQNVGIGTLPLGNIALHISRNTTAAAALMSYGAHSNVSIMRANGSDGSPALVQNGDLIGEIPFVGYNDVDGWGAGYAGAIEVVATEDYTSTGYSGAKMIFNVGENGAAGSNQALVIENDGHVGIGTATPSEKLQVDGNIALGNTSLTENAVTVYLNNSTGAASVKGTIVIVDAGVGAFNTTNSAGHSSAVGVVMENGVANGQPVKVAVSGVVQAISDGSAIAGQHCVTSNTNGQAGSVATPSSGTSIGLWLEDVASPGFTGFVLLR